MVYCLLFSIQVFFQLSMNINEHDGYGTFQVIQGHLRENNSITNQKVHSVQFEQMSFELGLTDVTESDCLV